tara:strand:+ start:192 stop:581 length:390 start_codon:yes stop_codon:yes gene_type:complete
MSLTTLKKILFRLFNSYVKEHFYKIVIALFLSVGVAVATAAIAWLLDPAIKKIFIEQDKKMLVLIPIAIVIAFATKGISLYFARTLLVRVGNEIVRKLQVEMAEGILKSDTHTIESKHSAKYIFIFFTM